MREWGWTNPVLVDEAGMIIAGHGRVEAARKLALSNVPVMIARGWPEASKRAYVIADNKLALNAGWDDTMLAAELSDLQAAAFDLELIKYPIPSSSNSAARLLPCTSSRLFGTEKAFVKPRPIGAAYADCFSRQPVGNGAGGKRSRRRRSSRQTRGEREETVMKRALFPALGVAGAGAAAALTLGLTANLDGSPSSPLVTVVSTDTAVSAHTSSPSAIEWPDTTGCIALTASSGSTNPAPGSSRCGLDSNVTLQDRVWFGAYWQLLQTPIVLGGGYTDARISRTSDGDFFYGIVDKVDPNGRVTDVILAFAGAQGLDAVQGESVLAGIPLDEASRATSVYEQLLNDPRYAHARIHVTGHSLGTGYTQYILAYALARHGAVATDARADFLGFGAPNWLASAAFHFGIDPALAAARMVDFTSANDPVLLNGVVRIGINNYLPAFHGLPGLTGVLDVIAAHYPTTYAAALGLPDWLSDADKTAATAALSAQFQSGDSIAPGYGPPGSVPLTVDGSAGREWVQGLGANDRLVGHGGADVLTGGAGADAFVYAARNDSGPNSATADWITDFSQAEGDRIDLSALSLLRPIMFVGSAGFTGAGQVRLRYEGGGTLVEINLDRDEMPDMVIRLSGRLSLTPSDFKLSLF